MSELIHAHLAHIRAGGLAITTITDRGELLARLDRDLPLGIEQVTVGELTDWLARPGWSVKTRSTYLDHICAFFAWATDPQHPRLDWNPAASLIRPRVPRRVPRPVTPEQHAMAFERGLRSVADVHHAGRVLRSALLRDRDHHDR